MITQHLSQRRYRIVGQRRTGDASGNGIAVVVRGKGAAECLRGWAELKISDLIREIRKDEDM